MLDEQFPSSPDLPPPGFVDVDPPVIVPRNLVGHTESILIDAPFDVTLAAVDSLSLEDTISDDGSLPSVAATHNLTPGEFGAVGTRRLVRLTDNGTLSEEVIESWRKPEARCFRYVVWNYTSKPARAVDYAVGEFHFSDRGGATAIEWTYSFALKRDVFPGNLGRLGAWLFRWRFLERDYAKMMRGTLERYRRAAEG